MTKKQAIECFREALGQQQDYSKLMCDKRMMRVAWGNFADILCKDGDISQKQYDTWTCPAFGDLVPNSGIKFLD